MKNLNRILILFTLIISLSSCAQDDPIVGVWEVESDYYQATYEIVEHQDQFHGKVHYYNDGQDTYEGNDQKEDYFLTELTAKNGQYVNGKMYLPDGSFYFVIFELTDPNTLEATMTVENQPYKEVWKRKI